MGFAPVDIIVVGGGIVGLATALSLLETARVTLRVVEKEPTLARHQTGNNSGVIHSGLYYLPGSLKATLCVEGRRRLLRFCEEHGIRFEICGKVVIATRREQLENLEELMRRGIANGLYGLRRLSPEEIREMEPHASGIAGLHVPETGIVDYREVASAYAHVLRELGGEIVSSACVRGVVPDGSTLIVQTDRGEMRCCFLIACAGLHADRVARLAGLYPDIRIVPFRGEYYALKPEARHLVRNLIYPVPNPQFPFLGVHFTRRIDGSIEAGPNAVLALKREGYRWRDVSLRDILSTLTYPGFWRLIRKYLRTGLEEIWRSLSRRAFAQALMQLIPEIRRDDLMRHGAGVRAQALDTNGKLLDDFCIVSAERMIHVLNAPSPAATASLAIGRSIAERAIQQFGLRPKT